MKAILLAAGLGTRLKPITDTKPKCLVPVNGKPLLTYWIEKLDALGVSEILINVHHFAAQVELLIDKSPYKDKIKLVKETKLLGTAGTLINNQEFWENDTTLVIHADNYCEDDLTGLVAAHQARPSTCDATLLLFETQVPKQCGIVELTSNGVISAFHEKVPNPPSNLASGALFIFSKKIFNDYCHNFQKNHFYEISIDLVPLLINKINSYKTPYKYVDIGTPSAYYQLQEELKNRYDNV